MRLFAGLPFLDLLAVTGPPPLSSEPIGYALKRSTAQVPHGADFAAGSSEALSAR